MARNTTTVLFDIGGVLLPDAMQAVMFTPKAGLVDRLGLDWEAAWKSLRPAYEQFNHVRDSAEEDFWKEVGKSLGVQLPMELINEIDGEVVLPNPKAQETFRLLKDRGIKIGVISNNTDFWYRKIAAMLALDTYVNPELVFLSHQHGVSKPVGLFKKALERVNPLETVLVDDRSDNIYVAKYLGFHALQYSMNDETSDLLQVVKYGLGLK